MTTLVPGELIVLKDGRVVRVLSGRDGHVCRTPRGNRVGVRNEKTDRLSYIHEDDLIRAKKMHAVVPPGDTTMTRAELIAALAECYRLTGADPDGDEDWRLAQNAIDEVRRMRSEQDAAEDQVDILRAECARLRKKLDLAESSGEVHR